MKNYVSFFRRRFPRGIRARLPRVIRVIPVSSLRSRVLNRDYRGRSKETNVLSFRYGSEYGEIIICPDVIRREARAAGRDMWSQTARMVLHAMIHLSGIHHEESPEADRKTMRIEADLIGAFLRSGLGRRERKGRPGSLGRKKQ